MSAETWIVFCCGLVTVAVTSWLWWRAETRYSKADARIEELDKDQLFTAQRESDKWAAREEAHCRQIDALLKKLNESTAARKDDSELYRRGLAELLRLMQAVVSHAERLADGETFEEAPQ